ncbi:hypothetical protein PS634_05300 [Pseudomonas fluorescens]|nr:hypothetical protein PS634_05300 [Pseudomonas fluorescens]
MSCAANTEPWEALNPRAVLIVIHKSASTLIVPIAPRGHAARDAPRHKWHRLWIQ